MAEIQPAGNVARDPAEGGGVEPPFPAPLIGGKTAVGEPVRTQRTAAARIQLAAADSRGEGKPRAQQDDAVGLPSLQEGAREAGESFRERQLIHKVEDRVVTLVEAQAAPYGGDRLTEAVVAKSE